MKARNPHDLQRLRPARESGDAEEADGRRSKQRAADEGCRGDAASWKGIVIHGGMDEVNPNGVTEAVVVDCSGVEVLKLTPRDFGLKGAPIVPCSGSEESAKRIKSVFRGEGLEEDRMLIAVNFAAATFALDGRDLRDGVEMFFAGVESGSFARKLEEIACKSTSTSSP